MEGPFTQIISSIKTTGPNALFSFGSRTVSAGVKQRMDEKYQ